MSFVTGKSMLLFFPKPFHVLPVLFVVLLIVLVTLSFCHSPIWFIPASCKLMPIWLWQLLISLFSPLQSTLLASLRFHTGLNPVHLFPPLFWFVNQHREILILNLWCNSLVSIYFNLVNTCISLCFIFYLVSQGVEVLVARKSKGK